MEDSLIVVLADGELGLLKLSVNPNGGDFSVKEVCKATKVPKIVDKVIIMC